MGEWYVIVNTSRCVEKGAHIAVESYQLVKAGRISSTDYRWRDVAVNLKLQAQR